MKHEEAIVCKKPGTDSKFDGLTTLKSNQLHWMLSNVITKAFSATQTAYTTSHLKWSIQQIVKELNHQSVHLHTSKKR